MPYQGAGVISAIRNGSDVIQDGGRKRKLLLLLDRASKTLSILLGMHAADVVTFIAIYFGSPVSSTNSITALAVTLSSELC